MYKQSENEREKEEKQKNTETETFLLECMKWNRDINSKTPMRVHFRHRHALDYCMEHSQHLGQPYCHVASVHRNFLAHTCRREELSASVIDVRGNELPLSERGSISVVIWTVSIVWICGHRWIGIVVIVRRISIVTRIVIRSRHWWWWSRWKMRVGVRWTATRSTTHRTHRIPIGDVETRLSSELSVHLRVDHRPDDSFPEWFYRRDRNYREGTSDATRRKENDYSLVKFDKSETEMRTSFDSSRYSSAPVLPSILSLAIFHDDHIIHCSVLPKIFL